MDERICPECGHGPTRRIAVVVAVKARLGMAGRPVACRAAVTGDDTGLPERCYCVHPFHSS